MRAEAKAILLLAAASAAASAPVLLRRHALERARNSVELCIEWPEVELLSRAHNLDPRSFLREARADGVTALAIYERPESLVAAEDPLADLWRRFERAARTEGRFPEPGLSQVGPRGLRPVLRVPNANIPHIEALLLPFEGRKPPPLIAPFGDEAPGYPDRLEEAARLLLTYDFGLLSVEFVNQKGGEGLARRVPQLVVRGHSLETGERRRLGPAKTRDRLLKAVRERGIRVLYLHLLPELSPRENLEELRALSRLLSEAGFVPGPAGPVRAPDGNPRARQAVALAAALLFPAAALWLVLRSPRPRSPDSRFWLASTISVAGGLLVAAMGTERSLMGGVELFRGVKLALVLPVLAALWITGDPVRELMAGLRKPVLLGPSLLALAAAGGVGLLVVRSGNTGAAFVTGLEERLRQVLETFLPVRPRFKEFLIGHPLLLTGLALWAKRPGRPLARACLIAGMIGQTSLVNTFSHFHIPVATSLVRTLLGLGLGYVAGRALFLPVLRRLRPLPA